MHFLIVSQEKDSLQNLASHLMQKNNIEIQWAGSGNEALDLISQDSVDLVIINEKLGDMTGLEFAKKFVMSHPLIDCALVSGLSPDDFHEAGEGLGLMAQLPPIPGQDDAEDLIAKFKKIKNLLHS